MANSRFWLIALVALVAVGCGCGDDDDDDSGAPSDDDADDDTPDDDADDDTDDDTGDDDTWPPLPDDDTDDDADDDIDPLSTHDPLTAGPDILPGGVESCGAITDVRCVDGFRQECAIYNAQGEDWDDDPDPLLEQVFYLDRYGDRYLSTDNSGLTFHTLASMAPGTPESTWADPAQFDYYRDWGDGAFYMGLYLSAATLRYAVTGTGADYARVLDLLNRQLTNWRVTGVPGYMFRSIAAMLDDGVPIPPGHPEYNLREYKTRTNHVLYILDGDALDFLPDYYHTGVNIDSTDYHTVPMAEGSPSQDAYSGAIVGLERAWSVLKPEDADLKDEIVRNVTCSLNRLRKMRITHLNESWLGRLAVQYLTASGGFHPDADDIDLSEVGTMIGYVQEAIPPGDPGDFTFDCPDAPPFDVDPAYDWDATSPIFLLQLLDLANKLSGLGDHPIDFIYFVSHRGGDVGYLLNYATFAYHTTGDANYLRFIRENLINEVDGLAVLNTAGSFYLPPFCGSWIGGDLIHPIMSANLEMLGADVIADELRRTLREEMKDKLLANDGNAFFGITYGAVMGAADDPGVDADTGEAAEALRGYQLNPDYPNDPKRNYSTDYISSPLPDPDYAPVGPTQDDIDACEAGFELFGITIVPGPGIDPDFEQISANPLPVGLRVPHDLIWHFSPFNLKRDYGSNEGKNVDMFADLTLPYWLARYHGLMDDGVGRALAWRDTGDFCPD